MIGCDSASGELDLAPRLVESRKRKRLRGDTVRAAIAVIAFDSKICLTVAHLGKVCGTQIEKMMQTPLASAGAKPGCADIQFIVPHFTWRWETPPRKPAP